MAVYVDDMEARFGRYVMCHMIADSTAELLAMADRIGVARRWLQDAGTYREHLDVAKSKRRLAIAVGAVEITQRELGLRLFARRLIYGINTVGSTELARKGLIEQAMLRLKEL